MATKEELLSDIDIITTISSKKDMSVLANVKNTLELLEQKKTLKSAVGEQYLTRLKQILAKSSSKKCFICKENESYDGILCEICMQKYSRGMKTFFHNQNDLEVLSSMFDNTAEGAGANIENPKTQELNRKGKTSALSVVLIVVIILIYLGSKFGGKTRSNPDFKQYEPQAIEYAEADMNQFLNSYGYRDYLLHSKIIYRGRHAGDKYAKCVIVGVEPYIDGEPLGVTNCYDLELFSNNPVSWGQATVNSSLDQISDKALEQLKKEFKYIE